MKNKSSETCFDFLFYWFSIDAGEKCEQDINTHDKWYNNKSER